MSTPTRQEVLSLYRSYLRIVKEWPEDKIRPSRGMKQLLDKKVKDQFRLQHTIDYSKTQQEMKALDYLLDNKFQEKYPISEKILMPATNPNYYSKLISSLEAQHNDKKSLWQKLFSK
ncbi:hypothetical protein CU098_008544 [Rhizopus stolonifer]|uniref:Mitochondrial nucleoid factor 1 n=1 Tax=Rhizopus stolonifer TaxID=4846 RepID=A0A367JIQ9_RHIST|nr:hypothetical protein CU098_008544 [Rhizopus stolonifer]